MFADKDAIVYGERHLTYREMAAEATRVARALQASGVLPGDRVAYLLPNIPEMLVAHFAVPLAGAVLVAINTRLAAEEVSYILRHSGAKLVVDAGLLPMVAPVADGLDTVTEMVVVDRSEAGAGPDGRTPRPVLRRSCSPRQSTSPCPGRSTTRATTITINYTSGTTGQPKGVMYHHRGAYLNSLAEIIHSRHSANSVYLWTLPMFHCNGWCTTWARHRDRRHARLPAGRRGDPIWDLLREPASPTSTVRRRCCPRSERARGRSAAAAGLITTAGAPPSPTIIAEMEGIGFKIMHVYGLTETYGPYTVCEYQPDWAELDADERAGCWPGRASAWSTADGVRVVDAEMNDVPEDGDTMGEIVMRGNNVMTGYFHDPDATEEAFSGGWFHSGDLGVRHPDGYIELRDRAKDIIISGGENISTIEVEQALMSHPAVLEVGGRRRAGRQVGRAPEGLRRAARRAAPPRQELIEHVRTKIARYKAPGRRHHGGAAEDLDREDPEVRAARSGVGRTAAREGLADPASYLPVSVHMASGRRPARPSGSRVLITCSGTPARPAASISTGALRSCVLAGIGRGLTLPVDAPKPVYVSVPADPGCDTSINQRPRVIPRVITEPYWPVSAN